MADTRLWDAHGHTEAAGKHPRLFSKHQASTESTGILKWLNYSGSALKFLVKETERCNGNQTIKIKSDTFHGGLGPEEGTVRTEKGGKGSRGPATPAWAGRTGVSPDPGGGELTGEAEGSPVKGPRPPDPAPPGPGCTWFPGFGSLSGGHGCREGQRRGRRSSWRTGGPRGQWSCTLGWGGGTGSLQGEVAMWQVMESC